MPDRYSVSGQDWPPIASILPLEDVYRALGGITPEAVEAAWESLEDVRVPDEEAATAAGEKEQ